MQEFLSNIADDLVLMIAINICIVIMLSAIRRKEGYRIRLTLPFLDHFDLIRVVSTAAYTGCIFILLEAVNIFLLGSNDDPSIQVLAFGGLVISLITTIYLCPIWLWILAAQKHLQGRGRPGILSL
jgi:hypothetical protein